MSRPICMSYSARALGAWVGGDLVSIYFMEYINIHRSVLDGAEFVGAEPIERATWLALLSFCCGQENGGIIAGCRAWADRRWQQLAKVTADEVTRATELWAWDGDDLVVNFYPEQAEKETRAKRRGGIIGNKRRWGKKPKTTSHSESHSDTSSDTSSESVTDSITERNGTERNETKEALAQFREVSIPSIEEVRTWAATSGRVHPDWAERKWLMTTGNNGWERNGRLIGWQRLWIVWFEEDVRAKKWKNGGEKGSPNVSELSANVQAIQDGKRVAALQAAIRAGRAEVENMRALGQDYRAEKLAVEKLMAELDSVQGGNE